MNNKENKIDILKEIIKENEELKEQNKKLENKLFWANNNNNYNEYWFKHWYEENKKSQERIKELENQQQKAYTTPLESIEQLEYLQKALNKKGSIDIKFIKCSVATLLKAMKYTKLCESHKNI